MEHVRMEQARQMLEHGDHVGCLQVLQILEREGNFPPAAHYLMGRCFMLVGAHEKAASAFLRAESVPSLSSDAFFARAEALAAMGQIKQALAAMREAIERRPERVEWRVSRAFWLLHWFRLREAEEEFRELTAQATGSIRALVWCGLGEVKYNQHEDEDAERYLRRAIEADAGRDDAELYLGYVLLRQKKFDAGWKWCEARRKFPKYQAKKPPGQWWSGIPLQLGTVVVYSEQGIGDTLQFVRFLTMAGMRVGRLAVECQRDLKRLLKHWFPHLEVYAEGEQLPRSTAWCLMMSLPHVLSLGSDALNVDGVFETPVPKASSEGPLRVGICWAGNPEHTADTIRSIPVHLLEKLRGKPGVTWCSLQHGADAPDWMEPYPAHARDLFDLSRYMLELDGVITVDTAAAHLAGCVGLPTTVLLPFSTDWRWFGPDETHSPWYRTLRLERMGSGEQWSDLLERVMHHPFWWESEGASTE